MSAEQKYKKVKFKWFYSENVKSVEKMHFSNLNSTAKIGEDLRLEQILSRVGMLRYYYCGKNLADRSKAANDLV